MDVKFTNQKSRFKHRVCAVIINEDKVLGVEINHSDFYCCPGGHVHLGESTLDAVKRELQEETGFITKSAKLLAVNENFFGKRNEVEFHELGFYYLIEVEDLGERDKDFSLTENDEGELVDLDFKWIKLDDLENEEYEFMPVPIAKKLKARNFEFEHIITHNLED